MPKKIPQKLLNLKDSLNYCASCSNKFEAKRNTKRYCNDSCRFSYHNQARKQLQERSLTLNKFMKRNLHLMELIMGSNCSVMEVNLFEIEKLGFRVDKYEYSVIENNLTIYILANYKYFLSKEGTLIVHRTKSVEMAENLNLRFRHEFPYFNSKKKFTVSLKYRQSMLYRNHIYREINTDIVNSSA